MNPPYDWQSSTQQISERGQYLLETGQWSDCKFIVGQEPHQQTLEAHKLFLAMSSPVFEAMFFGGIPEKNDVIPIRDVQPEAFKAMLEYIYTDRVSLSSIELAYEICYCAKKYMIPSLVEKCKMYLLFYISPTKACRAYECAKLFEEPGLMTKSLQIICDKTKEVLEEPSWEEVELGTLLKVLDQEELNINSELDLFRAVERWAKAECGRKSLDSNDGKSLRSVIGNALSKIRFLCLSPQQFAEGPGMSALLSQDEAFAILMNIICTENKVPMPEGFSTESMSRDKPPQTPTTNRVNSLRVSYINVLESRFIVCCFLHGPLFFQMLKKMSRQSLDSASSSYLRQYCRPWQNILSASLINESDDESNGMSQSTPRMFESRVRHDNGNSSGSNASVAVVEGGIQKEPKYYCLTSVFRGVDCLNTDVLDCFLTFSVDKNICVFGVQVPTQFANAVSWTLLYSVVKLDLCFSFISY